MCQPAWVYCPAAELEKKVYDMKRYIKTLHETVPGTGDIPMPTSPAISRPTSAEVPSWVARDLSLEIKPMVLVRRAQLLAVTHSHVPPTALSKQPLEQHVPIEPLQCRNMFGVKNPVNPVVAS